VKRRRWSDEQRSTFFWRFRAWDKTHPKNPSTVEMGIAFYAGYAAAKGGEAIETLGHGKK